MIKYCVIFCNRIYIHIHISIANCHRGTLAYASTCMVDVSDNNRPVAGYINICPAVSDLRNHHVAMYV